MSALRGMHGNYPDFQIREYALNWYGKGKLTEEDLAEVEVMLVTDKFVGVANRSQPSIVIVILSVTCAAEINNSPFSLSQIYTSLSSGRM